jgi:hypothetical protein
MFLLLLNPKYASIHEMELVSVYVQYLKISAVSELVDLRYPSQQKVVMLPIVRELRLSTSTSGNNVVLEIK